MIQYLAGNGNISYGVDSLSLRLFGPGSKSEDCYNIETSSTPDGSLSLLYTALPQALQSRVPKLRSLRSVASVYTSRRSQPHASVSPASSTASSRSESPPPSYHARLSISSDEDDDDNNSEAGSPSSFNTAPSSRPSTSGSATPAPYLPTFFALQDQDHPSNNFTTSIGNKSGHYGLALLNLALRSEQTSTTPNDPVDRRFYIDGVSYILHGLPKDLSQEETLVLRTATPQTLLPPPAPSPEPQTQPAEPSSPATPTLLHRTTSLLTFYLLSTLTLLLPHLLSLLRFLLALDAHHNISARFTSQARILLHQLFFLARELVLRAWEANDGAMRVSVRDLGLGVLRDFFGGVEEGVGRVRGVEGGREGF
jgi:hypothetical protein